MVYDKGYLASPRADGNDYCYVWRPTIGTNANKTVQYFEEDNHSPQPTSTNTISLVNEMHSGK